MARHPILGQLALLILGLLLVVPSASAASAGCGKAPGLTSGNKNINVNGMNRRYMIRLPDGYDQNRPYRLIFGLHWLDADYMAVDGGTAPYYGLRALSNNSAIFVAPDGLNRGWANQGGQDVAFIDAIVNTVKDSLCVDEERVFSLGFSYGGAMSYSLACSRPDVFRGIGVLSGALLSGCNGGNRPVAYYGQHGIRDGVLPIAMGRQLRDNFVRVNGCSPQNAQEPGRNSRQHIKTVYSGCTPGYPVQFIAFDEDHVALPQDSGGDGGPNSWTPREVWDFFSQF
ncbi:putative feruloyl esterase C [Madurella mycetomatis]|uniref:feruloyl esterase n=1 Tax=Madurella mycetomatis TaxID=100816 RepID=A0A175W715_9PEZI|nr:putative feruloyl esterase C [Madurella mycetomatis]KXX79568.1 putative feruloyl esterase C [Madurella mycetomatis]